MTIEAMKLALEALRFGLHVGFDESSESQIKKGGKAFDQHSKAITALRTAIEQAEKQEPVAQIIALGQYEFPGLEWLSADHSFRAPIGTLLYTTPPAAQRQPLTEDQIDDIWNRYCDEMGEASINDAYDIARAIEAAHGIKDNT